MLFDAEPPQHRIGVVPGAVGENELAAGQLGNGGAERRIGLQRRMVDLMHDFEKFIRFEPMLLHQAAHGRAVAPVIVLLQPEGLVMADFKEIDDVVADADVDLLPKIEVMRVKRVVEIEDPGVDLLESAPGEVGDGTLGRPGTRYCHDFR